MEDADERTTAEITQALIAHVDAKLPGMGSRLRVVHIADLLQGYFWHVYLDELPREWPAPPPAFHWGFATVSLVDWQTSGVTRRFDGLVNALRRRL